FSLAWLFTLPVKGGAYNRARRCATVRHDEGFSPLHWGVTVTAISVSGSLASGIEVVVTERMSPVPEDRTRRTVLVVEDALTTRCILEQFFARAGCEVLQAADPDTARMRL